MTKSATEEQAAPVDSSEATPKASPKRRRAATFDQLRNKPRRTAEVVVPTTDEDGSPVELVLFYRAIGSTAYDELVAKHPPTAEQKKEGAIYDINTFAPALISAVAVEPQLTYDQASAIYHSDEWAGGEVGGLFLEALKLQNAGLDVPFNRPG